MLAFAMGIIIRLKMKGKDDLFVGEDHEPSCGFLVTLVAECARRTAQGSLALNAGSQFNL